MLPLSFAKKTRALRMPHISPNQHGNSNRIDYITVIADGDGEVLNKENENTCIYKAVIARRVPAKFDESGINVYTEYELVHILLFLYEVIFDSLL